MVKRVHVTLEIFPAISICSVYLQRLNEYRKKNGLMRSKGVSVDTKRQVTATI